jgi:hypothetical protein
MNPAPCVPIERDSCNRPTAARVRKGLVHVTRPDGAGLIWIEPRHHWPNGSPYRRWFQTPY